MNHQQHSTLPPRRAAWVILPLALIGGCQHGHDPWQRAAVRGQVTLDGRPLENGQITFFPIDGTHGPAAGGEIRSGKFRLSQAAGPVVGKNRVEVRSVRKTGRLVDPGMAVEADGPVDPHIQVEEYADVIPTRYNTYSELTAEIQHGVDNDVSLSLRTETESSP